MTVRENGVLSYLHSDQLSSVSASTDASGQVVGRQLFEPFGALRAEYGEVDGSWGWATHRKREATGLTFMRARWYAPSVGRFVQPDSIVPGVAEPQNFNRYTYSQNNPTRYLDPSGHCTIAIPLLSIELAFLVGWCPGDHEVEEKPFDNDTIVQKAYATTVAQQTAAAATATAQATSYPTMTPMPTQAPDMPTPAITPSPWQTPNPNIVSAGVEEEREKIIGQIKSEDKLIEEHEQKLAQYTADPISMDNDGRYKNAPNEEIRRKVYEGRINKLNGTIRVHQKEKEKLLRKLEQLEERYKKE